MECTPLTDILKVLNRGGRMALGEGTNSLSAGRAETVYDGRVIHPSIIMKWKGRMS